MNRVDRRRLRRIALGLLCCLLPGLAMARMPSAWSIETAGLDAMTAADATALLADAATRMPPAWRASSLPIRFAVRDDLPDAVHGRARGGRIALPRRLLEAWRAPEAGEAARRVARAAVIHEVAHVHDQHGRAGWSRDPRLLDLAGWQVRPLRFGTRSPRNPFTDRSPDPYERTDPAEFVAVNLEHFLLDPAYACRRPALYRHFAAAVGWSPASATCAPGQVFVEADVEAGGEAEALLALDPARVYAIDYLLADANAQPMSRWGHAMLRLVVCAPDRRPGPGCRLDLQHHRVLSFRAWVDDVQISSWRGLTGRYPSRLFVLPFEQVIDEYTQVELRGLQSIPLRLDRDAIALLLERAATVHWTYDGRYAFVGNNCAVETWKLLHDALPRLAAAPLRSLTPRGLLRRLAREGVADPSVLERADAASAGYWFAPASAHYQAMFDVARGSLSLPQRRIEDWLALAPERRGAVIDQADLRTTAALLLLERAAARREELQARDLVKRAMLDGARDGPTRDAVRVLLAEGDLLSRPATLLAGTSGYGLPQADERARVAADAGPRRTRLQAQATQLRAEAEASLPTATRMRIAGTERNIELLQVRLQALAKARD